MQSVIKHSANGFGEKHRVPNIPKPVWGVVGDAVDALTGDGGVQRDLRLSRAVLLDESQNTRLVTVFNSEKRTAAIVTRNSSSEITWSTHAEATLCPYDAGGLRSQDISSIRVRLNNRIDVGDLYEAFTAEDCSMDLTFGPLHRCSRGSRRS